MQDASRKAIHRSEYRAPAYRTETTHLTFAINDGWTEVTSRVGIRKDEAQDAGPLVLNGEAMELVSVHLDGQELAGNEFQVDDDTLAILSIPDACEVQIVTRIKPEENTALEGLYKSASMYCTQCEAEGFRKITYYQDRPDVLSKFTTTIIADAVTYPVLLSNGNLIEDTEDAGRRRVTWEDPFPKPSYLFALVAGDLALMADTFTTMSGREVELRIYSEPHNIDQCDYAMGALKRAMRWDEEVFGREYDLELFMIVAVEDFNMGAMENKGLNIFNTSCVLASPDTATDAAYQRVEAIIGHEYFHNWSGNRVTCRDWFQLSLKEGFTVFRDAEFTSDMQSRTVKRIEDAAFLRSVQFAEDSGPLAHPVRPDSYIEISNFYTTTVYEKGAEVVGMLHRCVGAAGFRKGSDLYFERHDGQAVTTEDFVLAIEDANEVDLGQFRRWYEQAGTPVVKVTTHWHGDTLDLELAQSCPPTPQQPDKQPFHIPLELGLLTKDGRELVDEALQIETSTKFERRGSSLLVHCRDSVQRMVFKGLDHEPTLSVLRGFSAPVRVEYSRDPATLAFLAVRDSDGFARWDAMQSLLLAEIDDLRGGAVVSDLVVDLFNELLRDALQAVNAEQQSLLAEMLTLPGEDYLFEQAGAGVDVDGLCDARAKLKSTLAERLQQTWQSLYEANSESGAYVPDTMGTARRGLRNLAMSYLAATLPADALGKLLLSHLETADNLTDRLAALREVANAENIMDRQAVLDAFYARWRDASLVVNQWFTIQAASPVNDASALLVLEKHPAFDSRNPNKIRALFGVFGSRNHRNFHAVSGSGYVYVADKVIQIDAINPQIAARLVAPLTRWQRYDVERQALMKNALTRIMELDELSKDVYELVSKSL